MYVINSICTSNYNRVVSFIQWDDTAENKDYVVQLQRATVSYVCTIHSASMAMSMHSCIIKRYFFIVMM